MTYFEKVMCKLDEIGRNSKLIHIENDKMFPDKKKIFAVLLDTLALLFPGHYTPQTSNSDMSPAETVSLSLAEQIDRALSLTGKKSALSGFEIAKKYIAGLPELKEVLLTDIEALYKGDPAAEFRDEVVACYPGFFATAVYRIAHVLYEMDVPVIPRIMTEYAHSKTGIDIHPGASIGSYFFIDHGTGIVIGETTVIGCNVKLYQGVTLGAKSFEKDQEGNPVKRLKRHPNIGNNVIIYANATILGGKTFIGDNCVIGASTWNVESVPAGTTVLYSSNTEKMLQLWGDNGSGI